MNEEIKAQFVAICENLYAAGFAAGVASIPVLAPVEMPIVEAPAPEAPAPEAEKVAEAPAAVDQIPSA